MANPVIFDDGGSTRIKLLLAGGGAGAMDGLLDVDSGTGESSHIITKNYTTIQVSAINSTGVPVAMLATSPLGIGDTFTITSENNQAVTGTIGAGGHLTITIIGSAANPPMMEAKQFQKKRRYVIANAGPIRSVSFTPSGGAVQMLPAGGNVYTTVFVDD